MPKFLTEFFFLIFLEGQCLCCLKNQTKTKPYTCTEAEIIAKLFRLVPHMIVVIITCVEILALAARASLSNVSIACTWIRETLTAVWGASYIRGEESGNSLSSSIFGS